MCTLNVHDVYSWKFVNVDCTQLCMFNLHNHIIYTILYSQHSQIFKNVHHVHSMYTFSKRMYTILFIKKKRHTQFFKFNIHNFSKNVHNYIDSMYINFQMMYIILYIQCAFFSNNVHNYVHSKWTHFSKNAHNFLHSTYTNFQWIYLIVYI